MVNVFAGTSSNSADTVTFAAGIVKLVPVMSWPVPSLYLSVPAFSCLPLSGVIVKLTVAPAAVVAGFAVMVPPVNVPMLMVYVFTGESSNSADTVTFAAGMVKLVPVMAWSVPSLYLSVPDFSCLPLSGVTVRLMAAPAAVVAEFAVMVPPVNVPMLMVYVFTGESSNSADTVTFAAGMVKLVPVMSWPVPSLYLSVPDFNCLPLSGVTVRLMVAPAAADVGFAEIVPPVNVPMLMVYVVTASVTVRAIVVVAGA